jgi:hypothetical protein
MNSSSDDDGDLYIAASNIVANDIVTRPYHRGSVDGHHILNRDRQFEHFGLYQDYFSEGRTILGATCLYFPP